MIGKANKYENRMIRKLSSSKYKYIILNSIKYIEAETKSIVILHLNGSKDGYFIEFGKPRCYSWNATKHLEGKYFIFNRRVRKNQVNGLQQLSP